MPSSTVHGVFSDVFLYKLFIFPESVLYTMLIPFVLMTTVFTTSVSTHRQYITSSSSHFNDCQPANQTKSDQLLSPAEGLSKFHIPSLPELLSGYRDWLINQTEQVCARTAANNGSSGWRAFHYKLRTVLYSNQKKI